MKRVKVQGDANTEMKDTIIRYGICDCFVWPLDLLTCGWYGPGRCGRCRGSVELFPAIETKAEAERIYFERHSKRPDPIT